jgi:hypothetical protein
MMMRRRLLLRIVIFNALAALFSACSWMPAPKELEAPRIVEIIPNSFVVSATDVLRIRFSKALHPGSVHDKNVLLLAASSLTDEFVKDFEHGGLTNAHSAEVLSASVGLENGNDTIVLRPEAKLGEGQHYAVLISYQVRDTHFSPLVNEQGLKSSAHFYFKVQGQDPYAIAKDFGNKDDGSVSPCIKRLRVVFSAPLKPLSENFVTIETAGARVVPFAELSSDGFTLNVNLDTVKETGETLTPASQYKIQIGKESFDFRTHDSCTPRIRSQVPVLIVDAGEQEAKIRLTNGAKGILTFWYGQLPTSLDCMGAACPVRVSPILQKNAFVMPLSCSINRLKANESYYYYYIFDPDEGEPFSGRGTISTINLPSVSINEVMFAPLVHAKNKDWTGEYIELLNFGNKPVALSDLSLEVSASELKTGTVCDFKSIGLNGVLAPNGFAVLVGKAFDASLYPMLDERSILRASTAKLCATLPNKKGARVVLRDANKHVISALTLHQPAQKGRSIERIAPKAPDEATSMCLSLEDIGPTPGRANGVYGQSCE